MWNNYLSIILRQSLNINTKVHWLYSVQSLSHVWLFVTPRSATRKASLSSTKSWSLLKFMSTESVMPSNPLILCHPLLLQTSIFPRIRVFSRSQFFASGGQSIGASASALILPMNIQDWFPLDLTRLILQSKQLLWVFFSTTIQKHQFFRAQPSLWFSSHIYTRLLERHSFDYMDLCQQNDVFTF